MLAAAARCPAAPLRLLRRRLPAPCTDSASSAAATFEEPLPQTPPALPPLPHTPFEPLLSALERSLVDWQPPRFVWRGLATALLAGQVVGRVCSRNVHLPNLQEQLRAVGPATLGVTLLTSAFVGMVFTIQFVREFARLGLTRSVGGVLSLAFARELTPVISAIILAGRCGSAIAAELGTMAVSEQTDTLRVLRTDPVDYLVVPRVLACAIAAPLLALLAFTVSLAASVLLADVGYGVTPNVILESACKALVPWDIVGMLIKSIAFGFVVAVVSCGWGSTTVGGAKGVGESTTSAVVISLVCIFIADFFLSLLFFQGTGDALKRVVRAFFPASARCVFTMRWRRTAAPVLLSCTWLRVYVRSCMHVRDPLCVPLCNADSRRARAPWDEASAAAASSQQPAASSSRRVAHAGTLCVHVCIARGRAPNLLRYQAAVYIYPCAAHGGFCAARTGEGGYRRCIFPRRARSWPAALVRPARCSSDVRPRRAALNTPGPSATRAPPAAAPARAHQPLRLPRAR
jgi:ABC transport permease subunit